MDEGLRSELSKQGIFTTTLEELYNWGRKNSVWPLGFGLACCAIEMIAASMARCDLARFGAEVFRPSPRQADLMIVAGTVTKKMAPQVVRLYNQMPEPKYVIAMGACAISGGPFKQGYNVLKGIDRYIPVDVHIPGCPPRPEALLHAFMTLQQQDRRAGADRAERARAICVPEAPERIPGAGVRRARSGAAQQSRRSGSRPQLARGMSSDSHRGNARTNQSAHRSRRARGAVWRSFPTTARPASTRCWWITRTRWRSAEFLRDDPQLRLDYASNVTGVDWPTRSSRRSVEGEAGHRRRGAGDRADDRDTSGPGYLEVVYHLYSMELKHGPVILRLRTANRDGQRACAFAHAGLARRRIPGARDLRPLRHRLRRAIPTCGAS